MFRSYWTIIREHVPIPKLPLITYDQWYLWDWNDVLPDDGPVGPKHVGVILKF